MNMKKFLALVCVVAVAAVSVAGTLAYLTDREEAVNTFTVGKVDITLDEEKVTPDGVPTPEDDDRVKENEYHLIPGGTYVKDPTVTVKKGSEESYVRMIVTIEDAADVKAVFGPNFLPQNFVDDTWDSSLWPCASVTDDTEKNVLIYEFRYHVTVDASQAEKDLVLAPLFTQFTVPGTVDGDGLAKLAEMKIIVNGHAIQKAGFENADAAWAAFDVQMNG